MIKRKLTTDSLLNILEDLHEVNEKLKLSEEKYRSIFEKSRDAIFWANPQTGLLINCNEAATRLIERKKEEIIGQPQSILHPKEKVEYYKKIFQKHVKAKGSPGIEAEVITKKGKIKYVLITASIIEISGKAIVQGIFSDITEKKISERKLKESEKIYKKLFDSSKDAIMTLKPPTWGFASGNPACIKMFKTKTEKNFTSKGPYNLSPKYQPDGQLSSVKAKKMILKAMKEGSHYFEWTHQTIKGEKFPATVLLTRLSLSGETFLQATVRDITERKEIEEHLEDLSKFPEENPNIIMRATVTGKLLYGNNSAKKYILGCSCCDKKLGIPKTWIKKIKNSLSKNKPVSFEEDTCKSNGKIFLFTCSPIKEKGYVNLYGADITERKKAEEKIKSSKEKYRSLIENIPDVTWTTSAKGETTFISPQIKKILGYTSEEIYAHPEYWLGRIHPEDIDNVLKNFESFVKGKKNYNVEYRIKRKDGSWVWLSDRGLKSYKKKGITYVDGLFSDITFQKQVHNELKETSELYYTLIENISDPIFAVNYNGEYMYVNKSAAKTFKTTPDKMVGKYLKDFFPKKIAEGHLKNLRKVMNTGKKNEHIAKSMVEGKLVMFKMLIWPIKNSEGKTYAAQAIARPIRE